MRLAPDEISPVVVDGQHRLQALRFAKQLEDHLLIDVVQKRPKAIRIAGNSYARALHGILRTRPHFIEVLGGHGVAVLAVLAESNNGETVESITATTGRHPNTIRAILKNLRKRALLQGTPTGSRLAPHAPELSELGHLYHEHMLARTLQASPGLFPVARRGSRVIVEGQRPTSRLPATGMYKFQLEGAPVLEARFQYVITPSGKAPTLLQAYEDAETLRTSPRTLHAAKAYLRRRGPTIA